MEDFLELEDEAQPENLDHNLENKLDDHQHTSIFLVLGPGVHWIGLDSSFRSERYKSVNFWFPSLLSSTSRKKEKKRLK